MVLSTTPKNESSARSSCARPLSNKGQGKIRESLGDDQINSSEKE